MSPRRSSSLTIEHVLLALIDQKPMHGYELYQELCAMKGISLIWNIKQALLYAILEKLEGKGFLQSQLVQGETYPPRRYFHLTEFGRNSLHHWLSTPVRRARDLRQEFLAKLIIARRYSTANGIDLIKVQEMACQNWLEELLSKNLAPGLDRMDEWIVNSYRIQRVQSVLKWLKECESAIEHPGVLDSSESDPQI